MSDSATGLSYMQQRYMDPQLGIFLSVDPVTAYQKPVEQFNRYRYANGNPYKFTDPDGRESGAAFKVVNDATNGQPITPPPRNPSDSLGPAIGVALTAILAAPVLAEGGLAAMANPGAVATAAEIGAGAAGVTGTSGAVAGKITGYTKHGLNPAISRDGGRGGVCKGHTIGSERTREGCRAGRRQDGVHREGCESSFERRREGHNGLPEE